MKKLFLVIIAFFLAQPGLIFASQVAAVSSNKLATQTGIEILKKGGTAADAGIAMAYMLGVVEPQHSGVGGGGIALYYEKSSNRFFVIDYQSVAPFNASEKKYEALIKAKKGLGIEFAGVPGFVLGMEKIHARFGHLDFNELITPAITTARAGFKPDKEFLKDIDAKKEILKASPDFSHFFIKPLNAKEPLIVQDNLAVTLEKIAQDGGTSFYRGAVAKTILGEFKKAGGNFNAEDFSLYKVMFSPAQKQLVRDLTFYIPGNLGSDLFWRLIEEKSTTADADNHDVIEKTVFDFYTAKNKKTVAGDGTAKNTTHLSVVDSQGNILAMTNTLGDTFGSGVVLSGSGVLLNNTVLDYFLFGFGEDETYTIKKRARPFSYLTPLIIFKGIDPALTIGTSGGTTIPVNLFQVLGSYFFDGVTLSKSVAAPKSYISFELKKWRGESGATFPEGLDHEGLGESVGNIQVIQFENKKVGTLSDPRGEGSGITVGVKDTPRQNSK